MILVCLIQITYFLCKYIYNRYYKEYKDTEAIDLVWENDITGLRNLIDSKGDINICDEPGSTPIYIAAQNKNYEILKLLLKSKGNPNTGLKNFNTPLEYALKKNDIKSIDLLLKYKADPNLMSKKDNFTPLFIAVLKNNTNAINSLISSKKFKYWFK